MFLASGPIKGFLASEQIGQQFQMQVLRTSYKHELSVARVVIVNLRLGTIRFTNWMNFRGENKLASLGATLVRNYDLLTYLLTDRGKV